MFGLFRSTFNEKQLEILKRELYEWVAMIEEWEENLDLFINQWNLSNTEIILEECDNLSKPANVIVDIYLSSLPRSLRKNTIECVMEKFIAVDDQIERVIAVTSPFHKDKMLPHFSPKSELIIKEFKMITSLDRTVAGMGKVEAVRHLKEIYANKKSLPYIFSDKQFDKVMDRIIH